LYYFRVIADEGEWLLKRGRSVLERFEHLAHALDAAREIAALHRPSEVYLHHESGEVELVAAFEDY
jgi:hypothetical protein